MLANGGGNHVVPLAMPWIARGLIEAALDDRALRVIPQKGSAALEGFQQGIRWPWVC